MKAIIVFTLLIYYGESQLIDKECHGTMDYSTVKEVLKTGLNSPYQLAIDYATNTLFFSYTRDDTGTSTFESAYIDLKTNDFKIIKGIDGGFSNAVDQKNHIVYLGGQNGIYTFDYKTNLAKHIDGSSHKIWQLFFKNDLYYTKYPEEEVYIFQNGHSQRVPELLNTRGMLVALDNNDNIYFSNSSGLFNYENHKQKSSSSNKVSYVGDYNLNGFTSDVNGNLFFSTPNAIYAIDDKNKKVQQLVSIDDVYGAAVEYDGSIIYASEDSIIRLKPIKILRCRN